MLADVRLELLHLNEAPTDHWPAGASLDGPPESPQRPSVLAASHGWEGGGEVMAVSVEDQAGARAADGRKDFACWRTFA